MNQNSHRIQKMSELGLQLGLLVAALIQTEYCKNDNIIMMLFYWKAKFPKIIIQPKMTMHMNSD